jgi:hypothetical protein
MDRCVGAAARLPESERKDLAILALARSERVSDLAARHRVSRKFVYQQTHKARIALAGAFLSAVPEGEVLFELAVAKTWLHQVIVALPLHTHQCGRRSSRASVGHAPGGRHQQRPRPVRHSCRPAR